MYGYGSLTVQKIRHLVNVNLFVDTVLHVLLD